LSHPSFVTVVVMASSDLRMFRSWIAEGNVRLKDAEPVPSSISLYTHTIESGPTIVKYKIIDADVRYMDVFHDGMDFHFKVRTLPEEGTATVWASVLHDHEGSPHSSAAWRDAVQTLLLVLRRLLPRSVDPAKIHMRVSCLDPLARLGRWHGLLLKDVVWPMMDGV
jgi:hypothetical protein